jgi:lipopolysaccharide export system permease protein
MPSTGASQSVRYAASAKFDSENKVWRLSQVDESDLTDPKQVTGSQMVSGTWKTNLTPDKLGVVAWIRMRCRSAACTTM